MKNRLILSSFFLSMIIFFITIPSYSNELFSKELRQLVIESIDNACADSWCEGDYNYEFKSFNCVKSSQVCILKFYFINTENDLEKKSKLQFCHFSNITQFEQIIDKSQELNNHFYDLLDTCISEREKLVKLD